MIEPIYTTGLWYLRLCQALFAQRSTTGRLSSEFIRLAEPARSRALRAVIALPEEIGLVSMRELAPRMGELRTSHQLNLLAAEALAAALHLNAEVHLSTPAPLLEASLAEHGCAVRRIDLA